MAARPGGSISAGRRNVAAVILKDLGISLEAAIVRKHGVLAPAK
jgi:hypothetical protein